MKSASFAALPLLLLAACATPVQEEAEQEKGGAPAVLSGVPEVIDAGTLMVAGQRVTLAGIATPPPGTLCRLPSGKTYDCGAIAKTALLDLTAGQAVSCKPRAVNLEQARCRAGGYDLSHGMVHSGWALAWPPDASPYLPEEAAARRDRRGMWRGETRAPWVPE